MSLYDRIQDALSFIRGRQAAAPEVGLVLGSGLGGLADSAQGCTCIPYAEIPGFKQAGVAGHAGRLVLGRISGKDCALLQGRLHYYEGHTLEEVVFPVRVLCALGIRALILTNAAGGIRPSLEPGDLMIIRDQINFMGANPLRGANDERLGKRFPDMGGAYDPDLVSLAEACLVALGLEPKTGVYAAVSGPSYETAAEIRMLFLLGADAVGMSTAPEAIAARHMNVRVAGISCITNQACGVAGQRALLHEDVTRTAGRAASALQSLVTCLIDRM